MALFMANSTEEVAVRKGEVEAVVVEGLQIILKLTHSPDILFETAQDQVELDTLKARTINLLEA